MALQSSQRPPELLFYMKKSYRILQLQFYKGTHPPHTIYIQPTCAHYTTVHPENSPSRIQFYMQKTKSSSSTTTTSRGQRDLHSRFQKRNSTHRRQGDLLEMHPCVTRTFQAFQPQDLPKALQSFPVFPDIPVIPDTPETFRTFQSFMTFQPLQAILQVPVSPGIPTHSSILQLECIFYIFYVFYKFYSLIGFHRKLHRVPVEQLQTFYKHSFFKEREMLRYRSNKTLFSRIELYLHCVLSSRVTNYKNDIQ